MQMHSMAPEIVSSLYEGVLDPDSWFQGMERLTAAIDSCLFHSAGVHKATGQVFGGLSNSTRPIEKVREYELYYTPTQEPPS